MYKSFKEMPIWQKAIEIAEDTYKITDNLPRKEDYGFTSQIRRSALSISANIAEAFGRNHTSDKMNLPAAETAGYLKISPPLRGGDEGEGENSFLISPTLTLPPQGGGKYKEIPQQRLWGIENLINFYYMSRGSLTETQSHLEYGKRVGYIENKQAERIDKELHDLYNDLNKVIMHLKRNKK